jgi:hypothetical protein
MHVASSETLTTHSDPRKLVRHRSTTAHNYAERYQAPPEEEPAPTLPLRTTIPKLSRADSLRRTEYDSGSPRLSRTNSLMSREYDSPAPTSSPGIGSALTRYNSGPARADQEYSPERLPSRESNQGESMYARTPLRSLTAGQGGAAEWRENGVGSGAGASKYNGAEWALAGPGTNGVVVVKKGPPPPPPSRAKKPAPPPPPMKRAAYSETLVSQSPH